MSTAIPTTELIHSIQDRLEKAGRGVRDPKAMRRALDRLNRTREELRVRIGTVDVAVDLVRDARDQ